MLDTIPLLSRVLARVMSARVTSGVCVRSVCWQRAASRPVVQRGLHGLYGGLGVLVLGGLCLSGVSQVGYAQGTPGATMAKPALDTLDTLDMAARAAKWRTTMVRVIGPQTMVIDPKTHTVTLHLYNPQADTEYVKLALNFAAPQPRLMQPLLASALLSADSVNEDSVLREEARTDSLAKLWSLVDWVQEPLPVELWMAPHQTVQLTFHVQVPSGLKPGEYSAHVIVETEVKQDATHDLSNMLNAMASMFGGQVNLKKGWLIHSAPFMPKAIVKLTYHVGSTVQ